jgi:hypothetical protein
MKNLIVTEGLSGAEVARRLGVRQQTFWRRATRYSFPRLANGRYDLETALDWWNRSTSGSRHGGRRRNSGAKPNGASPATSPVPRHPEAELDALLAALADGRPLNKRQMGLLNLLGGGAASWLAWADLVPKRMAQDLEYPDPARLGLVLKEHVRMWLRLLVTPQVGDST